MLYSGGIDGGKAPQRWFKATVIFILKPGKGRYADLKVLGPTSLSSFLLKTLERLVDRWINASPLIKYPFYNEQHAYQIENSVDIALLSATDFIEG